MRAPSEEAPRALSAQQALLEKIEELALLRALNDHLSSAHDFRSACRSLVQQVRNGCQAPAACYLALDEQQRVWRLEAVAPADLRARVPRAISVDDPTLARLAGRREPSFLAPQPGIESETLRRSLAQADAQVSILLAPVHVRAVPRGLLLLATRGSKALIEERRRLLAIVATSAALALDAARYAEREEFLATLRHDINTPVGVALGYADILADQLQAEKRDELCKLADAVAEQLKCVADLVSNYLHMAAIDRGTQWLTLDDVRLDKLVEEIVAGYGAAAQQKGLVLTLHSGPAPLRADRAQLARVFHNLLSNAIKYTPAPGRIDVALERRPGSVVVSICDSGPGIAPEDLPKLFGKFHRLPGAGDIPGTGLGLYISRAIVEAHAGRLSVSSQRGRGSTFRVELPASDETPAPARVSREPA